jgi:hypothetical protein
MFTGGEGPDIWGMDAAAYDSNLDDRGSALLLEHCNALVGAEEPRVPPADRLNGALGGDLANFLLVALRRVRPAHPQA